VPFGVPSASIDGNNVESVYAVTLEAVERARRGDGATLLEMRTYRTHGHVETETTFLAAPYRSEAEVAEWRARDPIAALARRLTSLGINGHAQAKIAAGVGREVEAAFTFALESPFPDAEDAEAGAYATRLV
jgi:pyruvate dehydrogenase E1 component alpha subunit